MNAFKVSVVIPAYNEENVIIKTLTRVRTYLEGLGLPYEVIVVDDGSKDETRKLVEAFCTTHPEVHLLSSDTNMGKGSAIKKGIMHAAGDRILFMDADHSVSIDYLGIFMRQMDQGGDIVIASIGLQGAVIHDVHSPIRRIAGTFAKMLIQIFAVKGKYDTQRGFKLFTAASAKDLFSRLSIDRWGFDIEILVMAQKRGLKIQEIPVVWHNDKKSAIGLKDYIATLIELIRICMNSAIGKYD